MAESDFGNLQSRDELCIISNVSAITAIAASLIILAIIAEIKVKIYTYLTPSFYFFLHLISSFLPLISLEKLQKT